MRGGAQRLAMVAALAAPVMGQPQRDIIDSLLNVRRAVVLSIDPDGVEIESRGLVERLDLREVVAIVEAKEAWVGFEPTPVRLTSGGSIGARHQRIELTDGQRLPGVVVGGGGDFVRWLVPGGKEVSIPLEQVARLRIGLTERGPVEADPSADVLSLVNGDVLRGFAASVGSSIVLETDTGDATFALSRVSELVLANPPARDSTPLVWLSDATVLAGHRMEWSSGRLGMDLALYGEEGTSDASRIEVPVRHVVAVLMDPSRVVALSALPIETFEPIDGRRWAPPIEWTPAARSLLGAASMRVAGPARVVWRLPQDARRVAFDAEIPGQFRRWGDVEVVLIEHGSEDAREVAREALGADRPSARVSAALSGGTRLELRIEQGRYGPIQDTVLIERGLVLVGE
ncbi:MAG: hypothetical protein H6811_07565 [Phycisphaeraceae bacterium]|nr:hypothetical protein [Phycisphaeraceae bacterium]